MMGKKNYFEAKRKCEQTLNEFFILKRKMWVLFRCEAKIFLVEVKQKIKCELSEKEAKQILFALFRFEEFFFRHPLTLVRTDQSVWGTNHLRQWVLSNARFVDYKMCCRSLP
jgi:hypothetical protein